MPESAYIAQQSVTNSATAIGVFTAYLAGIIYLIVDIVKSLAKNREVSKLRRPTFAELEAKYALGPDFAPTAPPNEGNSIENGKT